MGPRTKSDVPNVTSKPLAASPLSFIGGRQGRVVTSHFRHRTLLLPGPIDFETYFKISRKVINATWNMPPNKQRNNNVSRRLSFEFFHVGLLRNFYIFLRV